MQRTRRRRSDEHRPQRRHPPAELKPISAVAEPQYTPFEDERFRALVQNLADIITIHREDGTTIFESSSAARILGYGPDGLILVVAGNVTAAQVRQAVETQLGAWPRNAQAEPAPILDLSLQAAPQRILIPIPDKSQTAIMWGHAGGLRRSDPDFYAAQVMNLVLGGGGALNSRLGTVIRETIGAMGEAKKLGWDVTFLGATPTNVLEVPALGKEAVEGLFSVKVKAVNTLVRKGKTKRFRGVKGVRNDVKKAIVTLVDGQSIDISTGI